MFINNYGAEKMQRNINIGEDKNEKTRILGQGIRSIHIGLGCMGNGSCLWAPADVRDD